MDCTIEIITGRERRRRWSTSDKLRNVAETYEQGATVGDVAARHGAYRSLAFTWRRQARDRLLTADVPGEAISPFVPVRLLDSPSQPMERPISAPSPSSPPRRARWRSACRAAAWSVWTSTSMLGLYAASLVPCGGDRAAAGRAGAAGGGDD